MFNTLSLIAGGIAGAVVIFFALMVYDSWVDDPAVEKAVEDKITIRTLEAFNDISSEADRARAGLRFCRDSGKLYDFARNQCK